MNERTNERASNNNNNKRRQGNDGQTVTMGLYIACSDSIL